MTMERFLYEGFATEELYNELKASPAFPLVRELEFKHGLKVLRKTRTQTRDYTNFDEAWLLVNRYGIAIGKAYAHTVEGKTEYCYRSPFYKKERGSNNVDRETIHSNKISSLMATISRHGVIPPLAEMEKKKTRAVAHLMNMVHKAQGSSHKTIEFTSNELHAVLLMALGKSPNSEWVTVDQNKCIEALDKWEEADRVSKRKIEEGRRMFANPFYLVGVDEFNDFLIGKFKVVQYSEHEVTTEVIEPFKRYRSYDEVQDLIPIMTMVKLAFESNDNVRKLKCGMPIFDGFDENLDTSFYYNSSPTEYDHVYMATPCPT